MSRNKNVIILAETVVMISACCILFTLQLNWQCVSVIIIMTNSVPGRVYVTLRTKASSEVFVPFDDVPLGSKSIVTATRHSSLLKTP